MYFVQASDMKCTGFDSIIINIKELPTLDLGNDTIACLGSAIILNTLRDKTKWSTGQTTPSVEITLAGIYAAEFTASNLCVVRDTIEIRFSDCDTLKTGFLPNCFIPDGNGNNDIFYAQGFNINLTSLKIFNRWGALLFETNDLNNGWDGTFNNQPAPEGVYIYSLQAKDAVGKDFSKTGQITLIR